MCSASRRMARALTAAVVAVVAALSTVLVLGPATRASAAGEDEIVALLVEGFGNGHGRGLSQYGAYGWSVYNGKDWAWILDHYYGGTSSSGVQPSDFVGVPNGRITVRLLALDDQQTAVISTVGQAGVNGAGLYGAVVARETGTQGTYQVWVNATPTCPAAADPLTGGGWVQLAGTYSAPLGQPAVRFTTPSGDDPNAAPGDVLGACQPDGTIVHYRGSVYAANGTAGENRTVNDVPLEQYLRGVVPRESPASWGNAAGGINALMAQAVAARSYALSEGLTLSGGRRYSYAKTCDSQACQVYGGAGSRVSPASTPVRKESDNTDLAVAQTANVIRRWPTGGVVSTEFSSSNGPRTAGGAFPAVDDPADDIGENTLHRWIRIVDAKALEANYGLGNLVAASTQRAPGTPYDGVWGNQVVLQGTGGSKTMVNWDFRQAFGLPSPGFTVRVITRSAVTGQDLAFIGDSVGVGVTNGSELQSVLDGVFTSITVDALGSRRSAGGAIQPDGVTAAKNIPNGTEVAIVELGYNDTSNYASGIDQVMAALRAKGVQKVAWVNLSTRRTSSPGFAQFNAALDAARARWPELQVLDWNSASGGQPCDRWYQNDDVHLTSSGDAGLALFLRTSMLGLPAEGCGRLGAGSFLRVDVTGVGGVPATGVTAVALNVTAVDPVAWGYFTVYPCGSPRPLDASHVNYITPGAVEPNAVLAPLDSTGDVCIWTYSASHVLVDVNGWFTGGFEGRAPVRIVDTRNGTGAPQGKLPAGQILHVKVSGQGGVPPSGVTAVALNVTAVETAGWGFFTVFPCASALPDAASHVNFTKAGAVEPNSVLMPVDATGEICIYTYADAHVLVDVNGWFTSGFTGQAPIRIVDTREGRGAPAGKLRAGKVLEVPVSGVANVPATGVTAVALNVTAVETAGWGFFTVWPCLSPMPPDASHVNFTSAGAVEPNSVIAPVDASGKVCIWTFADAHVLVDVNGWFTSGYVGQAPKRFVDTRSGQTTPR